MTNETNTNERYGAFLKAGVLKGPVICTVEDRKVFHDAASNGPVSKTGDFGSQTVIPVSISGIPKKVALPVRGNDHDQLVKAFGPVGPAWIGREIQVRDDANLANLIRVAPIIHGAPQT